MWNNVLYGRQGVKQMNINKIFKGILTECGGIEEMKKAFDGFIAGIAEVKVGSIVQVVNWGRSYAINYSWFIDNGISRDLCLRYSYNNNVYENRTYAEKELFEVLVKCDGKALITPAFYETNKNPCYLVGLDGLKLVKA